MVVLLIDIYESRKIKNDYVINNYQNVISVSLSKEFLELLINNELSFFKKLENSFKLKILKHKILHILRSLKLENNASYVFSKTISSYNKYNSFIKENILEKLFVNLYEISEENLIYKTIEKHLDNYLLSNNVKKEEVKVLYIIDFFNDDIYKSILSNINKFKCVDIAYMNTKNTLEFKSIKEKIDFINYEIGSSISFVNLECNMNYNIYFNFTNENIKSKYLIENRFLYINCMNTEEDIYNKYNISFNKNIYYINKLFNKLNLRIEKFNKVAIGKLISNKCLKFKEE